MRISSTTRVLCSVMMSLILTNIPAVALAEDGGMISTSAVAAEMSRTQAQERVQNFLSQDNVRRQLIERGVPPDEVSQRMASLSDSELRQMAGQMEQARAGGDILVTVLIVLLIIYLIQRI